MLMVHIVLALLLFLGLQSIDELTKAADEGDATAQFTLGMRYSRGDGVPVDLGTGAAWFTKAALQGDPDAQLNIGMMYERGDGVTRNLRTAAEWYGKAANQGHVYA